VLGLAGAGQLWGDRACYCAAIDRISCRFSASFHSPDAFAPPGPMSRSTPPAHVAPEAGGILGGVFGKGSLMHARSVVAELGAVLDWGIGWRSAARSEKPCRLSGATWNRDAQG